MFRNPINAFPYANAVDITANGKTLPISFSFQGDVLRQWCVEIRDNDNDSVYYTSAVQNNINSPQYNGDICTLTLTVGSDGFAATTSANLSWSVYMNDSTTLLTAGQIVTDANTYQSNDFYFINCDTPQATFAFTGATYDGTTCSLNQNILQMSGDYNGTAPFKFYQITLLAGTDVIAQSERIFNQHIEFEYSGFDYTITQQQNEETGDFEPVVEGYNDYTIQITLVNQYDLSYTYTIPIDLTNMLDRITEALNVNVYPQCDAINTYNTITWAGTQTVNGEATGDYTLLDEDEPDIPSKTRVSINSGQIIYNEMSGTPLTIPNGDNCGISFVVTVPIATIRKRAIASQSRTPIARFSFSDETGVVRYFNFSCANGYIYCVKKQPYVTINTTSYNVVNAIVQKFPIQPNFEENVEYIWYDDSTSEHQWQNNNTTYWLTDSVATIQVIIQTKYNDNLIGTIQRDIVRIRLLEVN